MSADNAPLAHAIHCQGGILTEGLLARMGGLIDGQDVGLPLDRLRLRPEDYDSSAGDTLREQALRAWDRLLRAWASLKEARGQTPDLALAITQQRWLRPLFEELGFGPPQPITSGGFVIGGRRYPISHQYGEHVPLHLLPWGVALDRRTRALKGAARSTPHSMMQEFLNRSDAHLWGLLCNGATLRLLRDNDSLTQLAYIEFDLEGIFEDERWPDFFSMWLTCHRSRFEPLIAGSPESCVMERWMEQSRSEGVLALDALRDSVINALLGLSRGFDPALRERLTAKDMHTQLLRLVYRLMFLCVTEERDALLLPRLDPEEDLAASRARQDARERYEKYYSLRAMRRDAASGKAREENPHSDLWHRLLAVARGLSRGCAPLALPAINSFLWSNDDALPDLKDATCRNDALLAALWELDHFTHEDKRGKRTERINWRDISAAELGSVYEALLELHPRWGEPGQGLDYGTGAGSDRKTTGSYYTPVELVEALLDSALDPLLARVQRLPSDQREAALLNLKVCDPSCGSGHFLIAAARRIGHELASTRSGEAAPSPEEQRVAMRDVVAHCIYGVDLNKMAVELCKVALWMEATVPGLPLPYLEHHIQHGNALFGATPALLKAGLPEDAITTLEGDDSKVTNAIRASHRKQVAQADQISLSQWSRGMIEALTTQAGAVEALGDDTLSGIDDKDSGWKKYKASDAYTRARRHADLWCAAFVWRRTATSLPSPTHDLLLQDPMGLPNVMRKEVERLRDRYDIFHWHLQFPQVFRIGEDGTAGGFDLILGNPPWETVELKDNEFFAKHKTPEAQAIVDAKKSADTKRLIEELQHIDPDLFNLYNEEKRDIDGLRHFLGNSKRYPLTGQGRINTYAVFSEHNRDLLSRTGRAGFIVPSGIITLDTYKSFFASLMQNKQLVSAESFTEIRAFFPGTDSREPFAIITLANQSTEDTEFVFSAESKKDLTNPKKRFKLNHQDISAINPNTLTCPIFRSKDDADITKKIHLRIPILIREGDKQENPWGLHLKQGLFNMASDSGLFRDASQLGEDGWSLVGNICSKGSARALPLWEAKMVHHFDHRFGTYEGQTAGQAGQGTLPRPTPEQKTNPIFVTVPRYWVEEAEITRAMPEGYNAGWLMGWRKTCRSTDERTLIPSVIPRHAANDKFQLIFIAEEYRCHAAALLANLSSLACDYATRQKLGGTDLSFYIFKQTPVLPPVIYDQPCPWSPKETIGSWVTARSLELAYTSNEMRGFAQDCGYEGKPFKWDEDRRAQLRAELDAAFLGLYGLNKEEINHVLESFHLISDAQKDLIRAAYQELNKLTAQVKKDLVQSNNQAAQPVNTQGSSERAEAVALILGGLALGIDIAIAMDAWETKRKEEEEEAQRRHAAMMNRLYETVGRLIVAGIARPQVVGSKTTWRLGGWAVEVDWSGPQKARARAVNEEQEEERGRAFALDAADLADQLAAFLRGLS